MNDSNPQSVTPALHPGDVLGYHEIQEPLGTGGSALVWRGYDRMLDRSVAIKQLNPGGEIDEVFMQRFRDEAELHKKLSHQHDNIVEYYEFIEDERGLFIIMEYVDGASLDQVLSEQAGPLPTSQAMTLIQHVAAALDFMHRNKVLHRDLKPSNILIAQDGTVKVGDFGMATLIDEQETLTAGSARYMAPEMFGDEPVDARADLYSLGLIAYEMIIGRPEYENVFRAVLRDVRNQSLRWMKWHTNNRLQATPIDKLRPDVDAAVAQMIGRLMAKDPDQRIPDATTLQQIIARYQRGEMPAESPQVTASTQATTGTDLPTAPIPKKSKLPMLLTINAVIAVLVLAGLIAAAQMMPQEDQQEIEAAAMELFDQGVDAFEDEQWQLAQSTLMDLAQQPQWDNHPVFSGMARAISHYAGARANHAQAIAAYQQRDFDTADTHFHTAHDQVEKTQEIINALDDTTLQRYDHLLVTNSKHLEDWSDDLLSYAQFSGEASRIRTQIDEGQFDQARRLIMNWENNTTVMQVMPEDQKNALAELNQLLTRTLIAGDVASIRSQAMRWLDAGDYDKSLEALREASDKHPGEFESDIALVERTQSVDESLVAASAQIQNTNDAQQIGKAISQISDAMAQAESLLETKDLRPALRRRIESLIEPLPQQITRLQTLQAYARGQQAQRAGNFERAQNMYNQALEYDPNHGPSRDALNNIANLASVEQLVQQGNEVAEAGDILKAISIFERARRNSQDDAQKEQLTRRIEQMKLDRHLRLARQALRENKLNDAQPHINAIAEINPAQSELEMLRIELDTRRRYTTALHAGDAAREAGDYGEALRQYREAQRVLTNSPLEREKIEIAQRIDEAEYEDYLQKGYAALERGLAAQALAWFNSAQDIRDTEQVRQGIEQAEEQMNDG